MSLPAARCKGATASAAQRSDMFALNFLKRHPAPFQTPAARKGRQRVTINPQRDITAVINTPSLVPLPGIAVRMAGLAARSTCPKRPHLFEQCQAVRARAEWKSSYVGWAVSMSLVQHGRETCQLVFERNKPSLFHQHARNFLIVELLSGGVA